MSPSLYDHLPESVQDPGQIRGNCSECGAVLYERSTATSCHDAGRWMRCPWPEARSFLDREEVVERERQKIERSRGLTT